MARRPIIEAIKDRLADNHPVAAAVAQGVRNAARQTDTAATAQDVPAVSQAVVTAIANSPAATNALNLEPWWKSRIWVGIITAVVGAIIARLNIQFTVNEQALVNQIVPQIPTALGLAVAAIGRAVGNRKGPIVWWRPWTIFGIGS